MHYDLPESFQRTSETPIGKSKRLASRIASALSVCDFRFQISDFRFQISDCRFLTESRPSICNHQFPQTADAQPLAGGLLQNVDDFSGEQVGNDIVDGSEKQVCTSSSVQHVTLARVVQHVSFRFQ